MSWDDPNVPKVGWRCEEMTDLGDDRELCVMCNKIWIRFQHHMVHPDRPDVTLNCGSVCAGRMEENPAAAQRREADATRTARARDFQPEWRWAEQTGNPWFRHRGWRCTVFADAKKGSGWKYVVSRSDAPTHFGKKNYADQREAMEACGVALVEQRRAYWRRLEREAAQKEAEENG